MPKAKTTTRKTSKKAKAGKIAVKALSKVESKLPAKQIKKTTTKSTKRQKKTLKEETQENANEVSKRQIIEQFATKKGDTGSPEVQIALSTQKIYNLTKHLEQNPKDNHSRRGLLKIISKRRRILNYLHNKDEERYAALIKSLGLKK